MDPAVACTFSYKRNSVMRRGVRISLSYSKSWLCVRSVDRLLPESKEILPETTRGREGET